MKLNTFLRSVAALVAALFLTAAPVLAQSVLTSTTLASAISDTSSTSMVIASATGWTASSASTEFGAVIDGEYVRVRSISGTTIGISRGQSGTRAFSHVSGAIVYFGPAIAFQSYTPSGQCTRTNQLYVPWIVVGDRDPANNGQAYDCLGVTTGGQWVRTDSPGRGISGSTVASVAGQITPTGNIFTVSGALAITGIVAPAGMQPGFTIAIIPSGTFTTTTANNISLASTAVVGKTLVFTWNGLKFNPSY